MNVKVGMASIRQDGLAGQVMALLVLRCDSLNYRQNLLMKSKSIICPLCGGNTEEPTVSDELMTAIEDAGGVKSDTEEQGGRTLVFGNGKSIRVNNWCNVCDTEDILAVLSKK